jgi:hypothetical protein
MMGSKGAEEGVKNDQQGKEEEGKMGGVGRSKCRTRGGHGGAWLITGLVVLLQTSGR